MAKLPKPNNIVEIKTTLDTDFFRLWCVFLRPFINLTNREIDVMAGFLKYRFELSKSISDPALLDTVLMSGEIKNKVIKECGISPEYFYVVLNTLRKNKVIVNNTINPRLIPNIKVDNKTGYFQLLLLFNLNVK